MSDCPTQKTHGRKAENWISKLPQVNCLICDLGTDLAHVMCEGSNWRQASEPAEDFVFPQPHECGNYEHDCPIFQAFKLRLMTPKKVFCPFCNLLNDGQCSHFHTSQGHRPSIKICWRCNTFGQHWSKDCPNVVRDGPLPLLMYCRICQSREHRTTGCPNAEASMCDN